MSKPPAGVYYICNRVTNLDGKPLAMNYNGKGAVVTAVELEDLPSQMFIISDYRDGKTQSISPKLEPSLQIGMGDGVLKVLPAHNYVWTIRELEGVYTIQDGALTVFCGLKQAIDGESVSFGPGTGSEKQTWILVSA